LHESRVSWEQRQHPSVCFNIPFKAKFDMRRVSVFALSLWLINACTTVSAPSVSPALPLAASSPSSGASQNAVMPKPSSAPQASSSQPISLTGLGDFKEIPLVQRSEKI
jgi:hypothetical protein